MNKVYWFCFSIFRIIYKLSCEYILKILTIHQSRKTNTAITLIFEGLNKDTSQIEDDLYHWVPMPQLEIIQEFLVSGESKAQGLYLC